MSYCSETSRINCDIMMPLDYFCFLFLALSAVKSIPVIQFIVGNKCVILFMERLNLIYIAIFAY